MEQDSRVKRSRLLKYYPFETEQDSKPKQSRLPKAEEDPMERMERRLERMMDEDLKKRERLSQLPQRPSVPKTTRYQTMEEIEEPILVLLDFKPSIRPMTIEERVRRLQSIHKKLLTKISNSKDFDPTEVNKLTPINELETITLDTSIVKPNRWCIDDVRKYWNVCEKERKDRASLLMALPHVRAKQIPTRWLREGELGCELPRLPYNPKREKTKQDYILYRNQFAKPRPVPVEESPKKPAKKSGDEKKNTSPVYILPKDQKDRPRITLRKPDGTDIKFKK